MVAYERFKTKDNFKYLTQKSSRSLTTARCDRLQEIPNIVIWLGNFRYFGKPVAEERWSVTRGGHKRRFDCISYKLIVFISSNCFLAVLISSRKPWCDVLWTTIHIWSWYIPTWCCSCWGSSEGTSRGIKANKGLWEKSFPWKKVAIYLRLIFLFVRDSLGPHRDRSEDSRETQAASS